MEATLSKPGSAPFSVGERQALVKLLTDEDPAVYRAIRGEIVARGEWAAEWMRSFALCGDPLLRRRSQEIVCHFDRQKADSEFLEFCLKNGEDLDLEQGVWLLARTRHPGVNIEGYRALLDSYAGSLLDIIDFGAEPEGMLADINEFLFSREGFQGRSADQIGPADCYLNQVVDDRLGDDLSLGLIYLFVCQRLGLPVAGIGMPGHFLCRFQTLREEIYIDAYHKGRLLTKNACIRFLRETGRRYDERFLAPSSSRQALLRLCSKLHQGHVNRNQIKERDRVQRYLIALSK
jgi:regulator of sirC expression with transglutaminase-like and TPR domain